MIRVLHIVGSLERNGIETFLMNVYRNIDREKVQFDFAIYNEPSANSYEQEVRSLGGKVYMLSKKSDGFIAYLSSLKRVIKENNYKIVWRSTDSCIGGSDLIVAAFAGANYRVLHAHSSSIFGVSKYIHYLLRPFCNMATNKRVACGEAAAKWMFGGRTAEIMQNGINTAAFQFDESIRQEYREQFSVEEKIVIGNVGRLEEVKNPLFLIDVFNAFHRKNRNSALFLIGTGDLLEECKKKVEGYGIADDVFFLGTRPDVAKLLQMFDVFVMPSIYEGFPVAMIEAQDAGLPCVVSDTVPKETNILGQVQFVSLDAGLEEWCSAISGKIGVRVENASNAMFDKGYDINRVVQRAEEIVLGMK